MDDLFKFSLPVKLERSEVLWTFQPHSGFSTISLTGNECALDCEFCRGQYLEDMESITDPDELYNACLSLDSNGNKGVLLSGGYNEEGYIPFEPFLDSIDRVKEETNLFVSVYSGYMPPDLVRALGDAGVDGVDFQFISDDEKIQSELGLDKTAEDYRKTFELFLDEIPHVAPHILLGLSGGSLEAEKKALNSLFDTGISALVFLVMIPPDTPSENYVVPSTERIGEIIAEARLGHPRTPLALGCMRPRGSARSDIETRAIEAGVDRIVLPSGEALETARDLGLEVRELGACCSIPENKVYEWYNGGVDKGF